MKQMLLLAVVVAVIGIPVRAQNPPASGAANPPAAAPCCSRATTPAESGAVVRTLARIARASAAGSRRSTWRVDASSAIRQLVEVLDEIGFAPETVVAGRKRQLQLHHPGDRDVPDFPAQHLNPPMRSQRRGP